MLNTTYKPLFGFVIKNTFYKNGSFKSSSDTKISEDFHILLPKSTENILKQFGLVFIKKNNGFDLMAQVVESAPAVFSTAKQIDRKSKLVFFLQLQNQGLLSFSDVAFDQLTAGKVYYGNNLGINADSRTSLRLSTNTSINSVDDLINIKNSNYNYQHIGLVNNTAAKVISANGPDFIMAKNASQNNGKTDLGFDLSPLPEGKYKLEVSGAVKEEFYYAGNQENVFAVIEIFFESTQPNYQILNPDYSLSTQRPNHLLNFEKRKTFWRYILNMNKTMLASPNMVFSDASNTFIKTSPNLKQAIFTSNTTIDSMEDPLLRGSPASYERVILKDGIIEKIANLPVPDPSIIKEESSNFYTEIIINI